MSSSPLEVKTPKGLVGIKNNDLLRSIRQQSPLIESGSKADFLSRYKKLEDVGHATMTSVQETQGNEIKQTVLREFKFRKGFSDYIDFNQFEIMLNKVFAFISEKAKKESGEIHGGYINLETVYCRGENNIYIFNVKMILRGSKENKPIKIIISDSEQCDADAFKLFAETKKTNTFDVSLSVKGLNRN